LYAKLNTKIVIKGIVNNTINCPKIGIILINAIIINNINNTIQNTIPYNINIGFLNCIVNAFFKPFARSPLDEISPTIANIPIGTYNAKNIEINIAMIIPTNGISETKTQINITIANANP
jgi:hypothetical protein